MKLDEWNGLSIAGTTVRRGLLDATADLLAKHRTAGENELASVIGYASGGWTVAIATNRGCHLITARLQDNKWLARSESLNWAAAREPEVWLAGASPIDLGLRVYIGGRAVALGAKGPIIGPMLEFVRAWESGLGYLAAQPIHGADMREFQGGLLDGHTFGLGTRMAWPSVIKGEAFGVPTGQYVQGNRVRDGGPIAMKWTALDPREEP
jgi:hypothetical protein